MSQAEVSIQPKALLAAINNNLNQYFYADSRDAAKQHYKTVSTGGKIPFMKIDMGESGEVLCELSLDTTLHRGKLNFSKFRKALAMMMVGIQGRLDADEELNIMHSQSGEMLFNIPGILRSEDATNIMVCGMRQIAPGLASIQLMYLNSDDYAKAAGVEQDTAIT